MLNLELPNGQVEVNLLKLIVQFSTMNRTPHEEKIRKLSHTIINVWRQILSFCYFYLPQRSWGKVMFLQASVILSTGGRCLLRGGCLVPGGLLPGGCLVPGRSAPGGGAWSRGGLLRGGACSQGGGVPGLGEDLLRGCLVETPWDGHCYGWYASFWNAFLLL